MEAMKTTFTVTIKRILCLNKLLKTHALLYALEIEHIVKQIIRRKINMFLLLAKNNITRRISEAVLESLTGSPQLENILKTNLKLVLIFSFPKINLNY